MIAALRRVPLLRRVRRRFLPAHIRADIRDTEPNGRHVAWEPLPDFAGDLRATKERVNFAAWPG